MSAKGGQRIATRVKLVRDNDPTQVKHFASLTQAAKNLVVYGHQRVKAALDKGEVLDGWRILPGEEQPTAVEQSNSLPLEVAKLFNGIQVRHTAEEPYMVSVIDILKALACMSNPHVFFDRLRIQYPELFKTLQYIQFPGAGQRPTPVVGLDSVSSLIKAALSTCRVSTSTLKKWCERLGCSPDEVLLWRKGPIECDTLEVIEHALPGMECLYQYVVCGYRIDMYIPQFNICIECDEHGHDQYDEETEQQRTERIITALQRPECPVKWVRYNPNDANFKLGSVIAEVLQHTQIQQDQDHELKKMGLELEILRQQVALKQAENDRLRLMLELHRQGVSVPIP
jgi:very-short-patch-repair endonuclease